MTRTTAIAWKEWHEARPLLGIAWFLFIVLPIIGGFESLFGFRHRFEFYAWPWVYGLTPVLAVLLGVYATCRDVSPKIEDFWQSRPLTATRLFGIKYAVNAAVLLLAGGVPLGIELALARDNEPADHRDLWFAVFWLAAFSLAFAIGCVVRKAAHAAVVGLVALLLLIVMPIIFPPLLPFHIGQIESYVPYHATRLQAILPQLKFAAGMLAIAAVAGAVGTFAVVRDWKIDSSRPLIYTAICAAFLLLIGSASYQMGTNLPVLAQGTVPVTTRLMFIIRSGPKLLATCRTDSAWSRESPNTITWSVRPIELKAGGPQLEPVLGDPSSDDRWVYGACTSDVDPTVSYALSFQDDRTSGTAILQIHRTGDTAAQSSRRDTQLWHVTGGDVGWLYLFNQRLYVVGTRSLVFDVSDPLHPRRLIDQPSTFRYTWMEEPEPVAIFDLPNAPGLSAAERLRFVARIHLGTDAPFDGSAWVSVFNQSTLAMYRLRSLTDTQAIFDRVAIYIPSMVQSVMGGNFYTSLRVQGNLLYASHGLRSVAVFNLAGPRPLQLIAHFVAAQGEVRTCMPLPDGRILAAGSDLWLLGPPPGVR